MAHPHSEFPVGCVQKTTQMIHDGKVLQTSPCVLTTGAWLLEQVINPPLGGDDPYDVPDIYGPLLALNGALDGTCPCEDELQGIITQNIMRALLLETAKLLIEYLEERGGLQWLLKLLEDAIG